MSQERDSHFVGFAKLLLDEIMSNNDVWFDTADEHFKEDWQQIIARRAYDLVSYTVDKLPYLSVSFPYAHSSQEIIGAYIPDMDQWPE